jgi:ABC-type sugar transport system, ATPase component
VEQAVRSVGLVYRDLNQPASSLSGGNQQKLLLARLFMPARPILVLSEPTAGVDVAARQEIYAIIRRQVSAGASVLILSSDIQDITSMASRAYVLARGRMTAVPPGWIRDEPAIARMVLGGDSR